MILHVDMDAFFASVEVADHPALRGKPIAVTPGGRSVVLSPSYEARAFGVRTAMPVGRALDLCPGLILVKPHHHRYVEASREIRAIFDQYTDAVEPFSIDEAFLDVTHTAHLFGGAGRVAREIKRRIRDGLDLTCSVGAAPTRRLAKLAGKLMKPDGLVEVSDDNPEMFLMEMLPADAACGIGPKKREVLLRRGIRTLGQVLRGAPEALIDIWGFGVAGSIPKSIGNGRTFERDLSDRDELKRRLLRVSMSVGSRARAARLHGRTVVLSVRYADFQTISRRRRVSAPVQDGLEIYRVGCDLLDTLDDPRAIRRLGISITAMTHTEGAALLPKQERWRRAIRALDAIRDRFGEASITLASLS